MRLGREILCMTHLHLTASSSKWHILHCWSPQPDKMKNYYLGLGNTGKSSSQILRVKKKGNGYHIHGLWHDGLTNTGLVYIKYLPSISST